MLYQVEQAVLISIISTRTRSASISFLWFIVKVEYTYSVAPFSTLAMSALGSPQGPGFPSGGGGVAQTVSACLSIIMCVNMHNHIFSFVFLRMEGQGEGRGGIAIYLCHGYTSLRIIQPLLPSQILANAPKRKP